MSAELPPLVQSLVAAVDASPDDVPLRKHLAGMLLDADEPLLAIDHCTAVLRRSPSDTEVLALLARASTMLADGHVPAPSAVGPAAPVPSDSLDWAALERELDADSPRAASAIEQRPHRQNVRLADVGGMETVKQRLQTAFLIPMANPALRESFRKSLRGGLLLYGPPGCGKTFVARALAGDLGAAFHPVSLADVLDMWLGSSERNMRSVFEVARAARPSVVFLDELDAIGQKRSNLRSNPAMRGTVNQLLTEMDGMSGDNEGVFVLAATNQPWDVDLALRRPGRFDRVMFVPPPDPPGRSAILRTHLRDRPVQEIDVDAIVAATDGYSGADLAHLVETAAESAVVESARAGTLRPIQMSHLTDATRHVTPSVSEWFATARNAAQFANHNGIYDELIVYMRDTGMR